MIFYPDEFLSRFLYSMELIMMTETKVTTTMETVKIMIMNNDKEEAFYLP